MAVSLFDPLNKLHDDVVLWRYMKVSTFFLLLEGKAFWPSVTTLRSGDPLEGGLGPNSPAWLVSKIEAIDAKTDSSLFKWLFDKAGPHEQMTQGNDLFTGQMNGHTIERLYMRELAKRRAVWCWFSSGIESAGMWSVYGKNGLAVRTTVGALRQSLPENQNFQIAPLRYVDRGPSSQGRFNPESSKDSQMTHRPHLLKAKEFEHEKEVRVSALCPADKPGISLKIQPEKLIQEIRFSPLIPLGEARALHNWINKFTWEARPKIQRSSLLSVNLDDGDCLDGGFETFEEACESCGPSDNEELPPLMRQL